MPASPLQRGSLVRAITRSAVRNRGPVPCARLRAAVGRIVPHSRSDSSTNSAVLGDFISNRSSAVPISVTVDAPNASYQQMHPGTKTFADAINLLNANGGGTISLNVPNVAIEGGNKTINSTCTVTGNGNALLGGFLVVGDNSSVSGLGGATSVSIGITGAHARVQNIACTSGSISISIHGDDAQVTQIDMGSGDAQISLFDQDGLIDHIQAATGSATVAGSDSSVTNCEGAGFSVGIGAGSHSILSSNKVASLGIASGATLNTVSNNEIVVKDTTPAGIGTGMTIAGDENTIQNNLVDHARGAGIAIIGAKNSFTGNTVLHAGRTSNQPGVDISGDGNTLDGNWIGITADGTVDGSGGLGIRIFANKTKLTSNVISGNVQGGVRISGQDNELTNNKINTDATGMLRKFAENVPGGVGVSIDSSSNGTTGNVLKGNVIAGNNVKNAGHIVVIQGATTASNKLEGNYIGVDATGNGPLGNYRQGLSAYGIQISDSPNNKIGGDAPGSGNYIGNCNFGIVVEGAFSGENHAVGNSIKNNFIGIAKDANVISTVGNRQTGISVNQKVKHQTNSAAGTGVLVIENNVISGNGSDGIRNQGADIEIYSNKIGTNAAGDAELHNGGNGISLLRAATGESENITIGKAGNGNVISGNGGDGIGYQKLNGIASDLTNLKIQGNKIGTNALGTAEIPNHGDGIEFDGTASLIGGANDGEGNLVSGNLGNGVHVTATGVIIGIQGNTIGLNKDGDAKIPNQLNGIVAGFAVIGFNGGLGRENIVSGNKKAGIVTTDSVIDGNLIGTDKTGKKALGNNEEGVFYDAPAGLTVSVGNSDHPNVISGNGGAGIRVRGGPDFSDGAIKHNFIGLGIDGETSLPNADSGIVLENGAHFIVIGGDSGEGNRIANNGKYGVLITGATTHDIEVRNNKIGADPFKTTVLGNQLGGILIADGAHDNTIQSNVIRGHQGSVEDAFGIGIIGTENSQPISNSIFDNIIGADRDTQTTQRDHIRNEFGILLKYAVNTNIGKNGSLNIITDSSFADIRIQNSDTVAISETWIGVRDNGQAIDGPGSGLQIAHSKKITINEFSDNVRIAGHLGKGIDITDSSQFVFLQAGSLYSNTGKGIDVDSSYGARAPNLVLTPPVVNGDDVTLAGVLVGLPNTDYLVQFYTNEVAHSSGEGEGLHYFHNVNLATDGFGLASFSFSNNELPAGQFISATQTEISGTFKTTYGFSRNVDTDLLESTLQAVSNFVNSQWQTTLNLFKKASLRALSTSAARSGSLTALEDPVPTGNVLFYDNGIKIGSTTLDAQGHAQFTSPSLGPGTHHLIAVYEGDANFAGSVSDVFSTTIQGGPLGVSAGQGGANPNDEGRGVVVDAQGNSYVVGTQFYADGASDSTSTKTGDIYLAKYDKFGALLWQRNIGSAGDDRGLGIARDSSGNIYITGMFQQTVNFNPVNGAANKDLTSRGGFDIFVASYTTDGLCRWARNYGNTSSSASSADIGYGIAVDSSNKVIVTGQFAGTVDFDASSKTLNVTSKGGTDAFVLSLTSGGTTSFAKQLGGTSTDRGTAVAVDSSKQIYVAGSFSGTADFDPGSGTTNLKSAGGKDAFLARLSSSGAFSYARAFGGKSNDEAHGVVVDASKNAYITGYFAGTADLNPSSSTSNVTSAGSNDVFIVKLNSSGNFSFGKRVGSTGDDRGRGITRTSTGDIAVIGNFSGTVDFNPSSTTNNITSHGGDDAFVLRLSSTGSYKSAVAIGGSGADRGRAIAVDSADKLYALGQFFESLSLDTGEGDVDLTSAGGEDLFLVRLV